MERRKILAIGKGDAYYKDIHKMVGLVIKVKLIDVIHKGGFVGCEGEFDPPPKWRPFKEVSFYKVKLSKKRY